MNVAEEAGDSIETVRNDPFHAVDLAPGCAFDVSEFALRSRERVTQLVGKCLLHVSQAVLDIALEVIHFSLSR